MRIFRNALLVAGATVAGAATVALASGSPPPPDGDPLANTVVAHGSAQARVFAPARRSDASVQRAVDAARGRAIPLAVTRAGAEAQQLAAAAGLALGGPVGIARDVPPPGWWDGDEGRFGPGRWCGTLTTYRTVRRADGTRRRVRRSRKGCHLPPKAVVRVTVRYSASRP